MSMMSKTIIGLAGRKRSGKSMLAYGIQEVLKKVIVIAVADNLKDLACRLLHITRRELDRMKDDGTVFQVLPDSRWFAILHEETDIAYEDLNKALDGKIFTNVREVLQIIGTDVIRKYNPEWHIQKTVEKIESFEDNSIIFVDDVRFPNEKKALEKLGGTVYFVLRPNNWNVSNHKSETSLLYTDFCQSNIIINDLSKEKMIEEFSNVLKCENESKTTILLSDNPWYCTNAMDMSNGNTDLNHNRRTIVNSVLKQNIGKPLFEEKGIILFRSTDNKTLQLFRHIMLNDKRNSDGRKAYCIYNPLTNEYIKQFVK